MAALSGAAEARAALRALLRAIDRHLTPVAGNVQWRNAALAAFRQAPAAASSGGAAGLQVARDCAALIDGVAHHRVRLRPPPPRRCMQQRAFHGPMLCGAAVFLRPITLLTVHMCALKQTQGLLSSYNLGVDPNERNKRMVEATARRVGFAMPHEDKPPRRPRKGSDSGSGGGGGGSGGKSQGGGSSTAAGG